MSAKAIITGIIALMLLGCPYSGHAQRKANDKEKQRQWRSMENGPWDFAPDWYYFLLHKKYSGAEMYWKWAGFQSGFRVRFKEHKSNVKRIMPTRVTLFRSGGRDPAAENQKGGGRAAEDGGTLSGGTAPRGRPQRGSDVPFL